MALTTHKRIIGPLPLDEILTWEERHLDWPAAAYSGRHHWVITGAEVYHARRRYPKREGPMLRLYCQASARAPNTLRRVGYMDLWLKSNPRNVPGASRGYRSTLDRVVEEIFGAEVPPRPLEQLVDELTGCNFWAAGQRIVRERPDVKSGWRAEHAIDPKTVRRYTGPRRSLLSPE